jgi:hypothetical protein
MTSEENLNENLHKPISHKKNCRHGNFEFYTFLIIDTRKFLEIYLKNLLNLGVLAFTPSISGNIRGALAKWL